MHYREIEPPEELQQITLSFWEFFVPEHTASPIYHEIFSDGCVSVFYVRNVRREVHTIGLSGLYLETVNKPLSAGDTIWGMRISPAALSAVLGTDPQAMLGTSVFGSDSNPKLLAGLERELADAVRLEDAVAIFGSRLRDMPAHAVDAKVAEAVRIIDETRGETRVDRLAEQLNLSTRQFQRRFKSSAGLTPKQYIRVRRIRAAAVDLVKETAQNWAERAANLGFSDQSHMTHEFVSLTNRSPNSFAKNVGRIRHGNLV